MASAKLELSQRPTNEDTYYTEKHCTQQILLQTHDSIASLRPSHGQTVEQKPAREKFSEGIILINPKISEWWYWLTTWNTFYVSVDLTFNWWTGKTRLEMIYDLSSGMSNLAPSRSIFINFMFVLSCNTLIQIFIEE